MATASAGGAACAADDSSPHQPKKNWKTTISMAATDSMDGILVLPGPAGPVAGPRAGAPAARLVATALARRMLDAS